MRKTAIILLASWTCLSVQAEHWPHWRGPLFNGSTPEQHLPDQWSTSENVAWSLDLPGPSAATPIIWANHVFISSTDPRTGSLQAIAIDRISGKILWQRKISDGLRRDNRSTYAAPSPTTDGKLVFFFYSNGQLAAFDFDGQEIWTRNLQKDFGTFAFLWTFSSSPTLFQGKLCMQVLQRDTPVNGRGFQDRPNESYLLALDPKNGETLWRQARSSKAVAESRESFSTPIPFTYQNRSELLVSGGDCLTGHDPVTGEELWRWGTWNPRRVGHWRLVPSPVAGKDVVLACTPKGGPIYAVKAGGKGNLSDAPLAWTSEDNREVTTDVPTPLFYDGDFFILSDLRKKLSRVDPATGRVKWMIDTPGRSKYEASPTGADGKIYLMNFKGEVVVVAADSGKILHTVDMGESGDDSIRSTIAAAQGQLFIRTNSKLYCIGKQ